VADTMRDPSTTALAMMGRNFPVGRDGNARYAYVHLLAVCHLACHAEKASCLDVAFWNASMFSLQWLGGKGAVAVLWARSML
jgi:hypothetical protein